MRAPVHNRVMSTEYEVELQPEGDDPDSYYGEEDMDAGDLDLSFLDDADSDEDEDEEKHTT